MQPLAQPRLVPRQRLQLRPHLRIARREVSLDEADRRAPLLDERRVSRVHRALALEDTSREALQRLQQQLVDRAEVVVDEAMVLSGLASELARRYPRRALSH